MSQQFVKSTRDAALIFDACKLGVVLRAVLVVEIVLGVAVMFTEQGWLAWLVRWAFITGGALPGTLLWLMVACGLKHPLQKLPRLGQYAAGIALGALAGLYACATLALLVGNLDAMPWLASAFAGALFAAAMVFTLEWRAKSHTPAATAARLAELQSRIRPHFLFNTLNSAIALVRQEPAKAEGLLEDLSELFRAALAEQGEFVTLAQEIELAKNYLSIEHVRFGERMHITWDIDPQANAAKLPPLLLQPLVENAVRHGVETSTQGANIHISTRRANSKAVIVITNTLPMNLPLDAAKTKPNVGSGMALNNVRERLSLLHDIECSFQAGVKNDRFVVQIELPV